VLSLFFIEYRGGKHMVLDQLLGRAVAVPMTAGMLITLGSAADGCLLQNC
jgi:hypothetical protein